MALSRNPGNLLRSGTGQPTRRIEQVLHDHGVLLDWNHDLPGIRCCVCDGQVHPAGTQGAQFYVFGTVYEPAVLYNYCLLGLDVCYVVCCFVDFPGSMAHVYLRKFSRLYYGTRTNIYSSSNTSCSRPRTSTS